MIWLEQASARRIYALFWGLGPQSAFHRSVRPEDWHWDNRHELLAVIAELIDETNRQFAAANFKDGNKRKPIDIGRPGREPKRKGTTLDEFKAKFL